MKHIVCKLNSGDDFIPEKPVLLIDLTTKDQFKWTFFNNNKKRYAKFPNFFSNEALDLFYISLTVFYADRKVSRKATNDSWTRGLKIYMPVLELEKWNRCKKTLENLVSFLSGDVWKFEFRKREINDIESEYKKWSEKSPSKYIPNSFCMLSGGLDSFIGAIDLLSEDKNIAFIGHYGGGKGVHEYQNYIKEKLIKEFSVKEQQFFNFYAAAIGGIENSTRTRSFMYFSHAIILASATKNQTKLYIPENGVISLNIPLTNTRLGSSSTRTTHPYYMRLLQVLLNNLNIKVELVNPYQFKTKGEMIEDCKRPKFLKENIASTMSCSHPDQGRYNKEKLPSHCGSCLPCVIRRASIEKAYGYDNSSYRVQNFDSGITPPIYLRSYKTGILDYRNNKHSVSFKIQESGPLVSNLIEYEKLYIRGIEELSSLLDKYGN